MCSAAWLVPIQILKHLAGLYYRWPLARCRHDARGCRTVWRRKGHDDTTVGRRAAPGCVVDLHQHAALLLDLLELWRELDGGLSEAGGRCILDVLDAHGVDSVCRVRSRDAA